MGKLWTYETSWTIHKQLCLSHDEGQKKYKSIRSSISELMLEIMVFSGDEININIIQVYKMEVD